MGFKNYILKEQKNDEQGIIDALKRVAGVDSVVEKSRSSKTVTFHLKSTDRVSLKKSFRKLIAKQGYKFQEVNASATILPEITTQAINGVKYKVFFKPASGGMSETTLNSTITELVPCIAFMSKLKYKDYADLYTKIFKVMHKQKSVYVGSSDYEAGVKFIADMPGSKLYQEKMDNAIAIHKYLIDLDKKKKIAQVWWTYRGKPEGVPANSPADIVVKFTDGELLGVSLKAGGANTKEPQLNTYVKPVLEFFEKNIEQIKKQLWKISYKELGLPADYDGAKNRPETYEVLRKLETEDPTKYNELYDKNLEYLRKKIVNVTANEDDSKFIDFINAAILKKDDNVPVVIIKAVKQDWHEVTTGNDLETAVPMVVDVKGSAKGKSKQNFTIELVLKGEPNKIMNFSIRSNKTGVAHKLGQFFNLAVKFNGVEEK